MALTQKYNCTACHSVDQKIVGPAFADVAKKYAGKPDAVSYLMTKTNAAAIAERRRSQNDQ
jgi:cytochrome c551/c552